MAASVNEEAALRSCRYSPGLDFEEEQKEASVEIPLTDSTEFWLIQEPMNQLLPDDLTGKEISLKLRSEDKIGKLISSAGKSFELVPFTSQEPDAAIFLPVASKPKAAVKISRRVCLVHYPDASDLEKPKPHLSSSSQRSGGSQRSSMPSRLSTPSILMVADSATGTSHCALTSTHSMEQSVESTKHSRQKRARDSSSSLRTGSSSGYHSQLSQPESQVTDDSFGSPDELLSKSSKKKRKAKQ